MKTQELTFADNGRLRVMLGPHNLNLERLARRAGIQATSRGNKITLKGPADSLAEVEAALLSLWERAGQDGVLETADVDAALRLSEGGAGDVSALIIRTKKRVIHPRSPNQAAYVQALKSSDLVFGLGPAGTGKTYLAVAKAVAQLIRGDVERIVLSRPAVEAGERLGFLPGDLREKVDPYLRPLYDALYDMLPADQVKKKLEAGEIEVAPLAFMRGRTLANAFVILDEAQNTSPMQMKMFLTRLGEGSRMAVTGDPSQIDLPAGQASGLLDALETLKGVSGVGVVRFGAQDVVRHDLVTRIVKAYEAKEKKRERARNG
ncbi:putative enzyme with nucleoside triphosphate hydrolase domain [Rhodospirillaceae bacterium LM-1]|nr:putative enzyme with nucleoside triphosphate hydrolase domain [Rhodospirillaceae bacterium LM-1]